MTTAAAAAPTRRRPPAAADERGLRRRARARAPRRRRRAALPPAAVQQLRRVRHGRPRARPEIVWEGSRGAAGGWAWRGYEFAAAVDNVAKRPRFLAPWHYRLDWVRWIAACRGRAERARRDGSAAWTTRLTAAMLRRDATLLRTLRVRDPFDGEDDGPTHVRAALSLPVRAARLGCVLDARAGRDIHQADDARGYRRRGEVNARARRT